MYCQRRWANLQDIGPHHNLNFVRIFSQDLELKNSVKYSSRFHTSLSVCSFNVSTSPKAPTDSCYPTFLFQRMVLKGSRVPLLAEWQCHGYNFEFHTHAVISSWFVFFIISMQTCSCSQSQRYELCAIRHLELGNKIVLYCEI